MTAFIIPLVILFIQPYRTNTQHDSCKVIFFRDRHFEGGAWNKRILDGQVSIGVLKNGDYFTYVCPAGDHVFKVRHERRMALKLHTEAGKTYYVQFRLTPPDPSIVQAAAVLMGSTDTSQHLINILTTTDSTAAAMSLRRIDARKAKKASQ